MYCYRCGMWKAQTLCPACGADESRRPAPRTEEGRALRALFDTEGVGPGQTIGDADLFLNCLTDILPGERYSMFRRQVWMIAGSWEVRSLMQNTLRAAALPDQALYAELCRRAEETGFVQAVCRRVVDSLYEMIGWEIPGQAAPEPIRPTAQQQTPPPVNPAGIEEIRRLFFPPQAPSPAQRAAIRAGQVVRFGRYPHSASGSDNTMIEWRVLEVRGNSALLISRYGLDAKPYNEKRAAVTWETCSLRAWLNGDFFRRAFNTQEKNAVALTRVDSSAAQGNRAWRTDGGNATQDRVFLLSCAEAAKYFQTAWRNGDSAIARVQPTEWAFRHSGAFINSGYRTVDGGGAGWWWLRSPRRNAKCAARVSVDGSLGNSDVDWEIGCVRPAIWVRLDACGF